MYEIVCSLKGEYNFMLVISVIIPVYNVERYLLECIDSVLSQSYKNIEIILVDDGSTDSSSLICDQIKEKSDKVVVIHKQNGGLSDARNAGIQAATGEYILFLDSDDFWDDKNAVFNLVNRVTKTQADVLNFSYKKYYADTNKKVPYFSGLDPMPEGVNTLYDQLSFLTEKGLYIASACNKMIRRSIFSKDLFFREGTFSEDIEWCAKLMATAKSMDFICENFYCYRQRESSISHTINTKKCEDLCNNIVRCFRVAADVDNNLKKFMYSYISYQYGTFFVVQALAESFQKKSISKLEDYKWVLKYYGHNKKLMFLYLGCKLIGYKNICVFVRKGYRLLAKRK